MSSQSPAAIHLQILLNKANERIKELEAECVAAKDYMVKCGEQSSLDAKRIAELEAAARCAPVVVGYVSYETAFYMRNRLKLTTEIIVAPLSAKDSPELNAIKPCAAIYLDPQPPNQGE